MPNHIKVFERTEFPGVLKGYESYTVGNSSNVSRYAKQPGFASAGVYTALHMYRCIQNGTRNYLQASLNSEELAAGIGEGPRAEMLAEMSISEKEVACISISSRGVIKGAVMDRERETLSRLSTKSPLLLLALMERLLKNDEARIAYQMIEYELSLNPLTDSIDQFENQGVVFFENLVKLTDNFIHRMVNLDTDDDIKLTQPNSTNYTLIDKDRIMSGNYMPVGSKGNFLVFYNVKESELSDKAITMESFAGKYNISDRVLTDEEEKLVPYFDEKWSIPKQAVKVCKYIGATNVHTSRRNFMLEGPAGTGKTTVAALVAAGIHRPYVYLTCNANTEIFDFIGQIFPVGSNKKINIGEFLKEHSLPTPMDIHFDVEGSYKHIMKTNEIPEALDECEVNLRLLSLVMDILKKDTGNGFIYHETDFIRALKYGYVCEIQEPSVIVQPGVMVGLNGLLDINRSYIKLPTGEVVRRHPDTVFICTTNMNYNGCIEFNQSVVSRMQLVLKMGNPSYKEMAVNAMKRSGYTNHIRAEEMARTVCSISDYLRNEQISDGVCGQRELIDWMSAVLIEGEDCIVECATDTIVNKATFDDNARDYIQGAFIDSAFLG